MRLAEFLATDILMYRIVRSNACLVRFPVVYRSLCGLLATYLYGQYHNSMASIFVPFLF